MGNTNNTSSNTRNIPVWAKKVQEPSSQVTPKTLKKEVVKPVENWLLDATKKATELWKYDGSYDVKRWKKLYRGWNEDWVFWTDDIDIAKSFWDEWIVEKLITMKNPLDVRSKEVREFIKKNSDINIDNATSAYSRSLPEFKKLMKWAEENGFDGIIWKTSDNWLNYTWNEFVTIWKKSSKPTK